MCIQRERKDDIDMIAPEDTTYFLATKFMASERGKKLVYFAPDAHEIRGSWHEITREEYRDRSLGRECSSELVEWSIFDFLVKQKANNDLSVAITPVLIANIRRLSRFMRSDRMEAETYGIWKITPEGLSTTDNGYHISADTLWDGFDPDDPFETSWEDHLRHKPRMDYSNFMKAIRIARRVHAKHMPASLRKCNTKNSQAARR